MITIQPSNLLTNTKENTKMKRLTKGLLDNAFRTLVIQNNDYHTTYRFINRISKMIRKWRHLLTIVHTSQDVQIYNISSSCGTFWHNRRRLLPKVQFRKTVWQTMECTPSCHGQRYILFCKYNTQTNYSSTTSLDHYVPTCHEYEETDI